MCCTDTLTVHHNLKKGNNGKVRRVSLTQWVTSGSHQRYFSSWQLPHSSPQASEDTQQPSLSAPLARAPERALPVLLPLQLM